MISGVKKMKSHHVFYDSGPIQASFLFNSSPPLLEKLVCFYEDGREVSDFEITTQMETQQNVLYHEQETLYNIIIKYIDGSIDHRVRVCIGFNERKGVTFMGSSHDESWRGLVIQPEARQRAFY